MHLGKVGQFKFDFLAGAFFMSRGVYGIDDRPLCHFGIKVKQIRNNLYYFLKTSGKLAETADFVYKTL